MADLPTNALSAGYMVTASGGTMNGQAMTGSMKALYAPDTSSSNSNVTLLTSPIANLAARSSVPGTALQRYQGTAQGLVDAGRIPSDFS